MTSRPAGEASFSQLARPSSIQRPAGEPEAPAALRRLVVALAKQAAREALAESGQPKPATTAKPQPFDDEVDRHATRHHA